MAAYHATYQTDLAGPSRVIAIPSIFAMGDNESHTFTVQVYDSRNPEAGLMDGTVAGVVVRPDGATVPLTGTKGEETVDVTLPDGSTAQATECSMTLIQGCFAYAGQITIVIRLVNGGAQTAVLVARGTVTTSLTDTIVDPGEVVPDIATLLAMVEACEEATAAAQEAAEDITNAKITPKNLAQGTTWTNGKIIKYADGAQRASSTCRSTGYIDLTGVTSITYQRMTFSSDSGYPGIAFYNASKQFIADSGIPAIYGAQSSGWTMSTVTVPEGAKYVRCSWWNAGYEMRSDEFYIFDASEFDATMMELVLGQREEMNYFLRSVCVVDSMTAANAHASGSLVLVDGVLYKCNEAITIGQTISEHASMTKLETILNSLEARIAALGG